MQVYRIAKKRYATDLFASGIANRWNLDNQFVLYASSSRALASLELLVHRAAIKPSFEYRVMLIDMDLSPNQITSYDKEDLPPDWRSIDAYPDLQQLGSEWYESKSSLTLRIPSVVISQEYNFVINTMHPLYRERITLGGTESFFWDQRLLEY